MAHSRRALLSGLSASALVLPTSCARASDPDALSAVTGACPIPGRSVGAVTGPFPPPEFVPTLRGAPNPGVRLPVAENDMDLTVIQGVTGSPKGQVVQLTGVVMSPSCQPIPGASVQLWQADAAGNYNHENERDAITAAQLDPAFGYWGSTLTDAQGRFSLRTVVPGAYPAGRDWWRPPHLHWTLSAEGMRPVTTQTYFEGASIQGIDRIRQLHEADYILNLRQNFKQGLSGAELTTARARALAELVTAFKPGEDGVPRGEVIFRLG